MRKEFIVFGSIIMLMLALFLFKNFKNSEPKYDKDKIQMNFNYDDSIYDVKVVDSYAGEEDINYDTEAEDSENVNSVDAVDEDSTTDTNEGESWSIDQVQLDSTLIGELVHYYAVNAYNGDLFGVFFTDELQEKFDSRIMADEPYSSIEHNFDLVGTKILDGAVELEFQDGGIWRFGYELTEDESRIQDIYYIGEGVE